MAAAGNRPKPTGDFCFELAAGDVLFGSLVALDDKQAELDVPTPWPHPRRAIQPPSP